jgi:PAS domain S-box-containing protein
MGGMVVVLSYLHGTPLLYGTLTIPMAATTALAFLLLGTGQLLAVGPDGFPSRLFSGHSVRARLLRAFVSTTVGVVVAIDLLHVYARGVFFEDNAILSGVSATAVAVITGALIARVALKVGDDVDRSEEIRREAEDKLRESEDRYRDLVEHSQDLICTHDLEGRILSANPWAATILDYAPEELLRMNFRELLVPEVRHEFERYLEEIRMHGTARGLMRVQTRWGKSRIWEYKNTLRTENVAEPIVRGMAHDVTESKRAEAEKRSLEEQVRRTQKLESLGVLAGGIAHDFNNILMSVLGHAELALAEISPMSPARGNITEIATAARRAAELCRQMLAYAGKTSIALERVVLRDLVEEMAHLLKTAISKKAILNLNLERGLPPIEADPSQIRQIVMNLIINASEAIGDRSGVVTVSVGATRCDEEYLSRTELRETLAPGLYLHLEVADTGCGIGEETRLRIFEPFFSTKFTGRGLGLAAVLGIVRAHKGALKVYSEPGKGTTFKILFPAMEGPVEEARTIEPAPLADWRGKGTILLVDDEESLVALGARMLEHLGFTVLLASDGLQAVELYRERGKEIDMVLMDLTMPHMDGAEAFGELRRLNPAVRVVLASGYSHEDVASRFAGKGLNGVLQKPYTLLKLRESLAGLLPIRQEGDA